MGPPTQLPVGLRVTRVARVVSRAFDEALTEAGGSLPVWLILLNLKVDPGTNQRALAAAVGVREATLTHHLNAMERDGLLSRTRDPDNRRAHVIELSATGGELFLRLRGAAMRFDRQLRTAFTPSELERLATLLDRLARNAGGSADGPPWAGLAERPPPGGRPARRG